MTSEDAGIEAGVSAAVGTRWFRSSGGMRPISLEPHTGRYLSFAEREELAVLRAQWVVWRLRGRPGPNPMKNWKHVYSLPDIVPIFHHSDCGPSHQEGDSAQV